MNEFIEHIQGRICPFSSNSALKKQFKLLFLVVVDSLFQEIYIRLHIFVIRI